jgi:hypothetical protein
MRYLTFLLVLISVLGFPLNALAGVWNFEKKFAGRKNVAYQEIVQEIYNWYDKSAKSPESLGTSPDLKQMLRSIFEPTAVKIPFRVVDTVGTNRNVQSEGNIYFGRGQIFVRYDRATRNKTSNSIGTNFATIGKNLYAWEPDKKEGEILRRFTGDTIELVDYLIDPAMIMRYTYFDYKKNPNNYTVKEDANSTSIFHKKIKGFAGIKFNSSPLWFNANIISDCHQNCPPLDDQSKLTLLEVDKPVSIKQIPAAVQKLPPGVKFKKTPASVDSYLTYL